MLRKLGGRLHSGQKLERAIAASGMSRRELARSSGVARGTIDRMCSSPDAGYLWSWVQVARALNVEVSELMGDCDEP